MQHHEHHDADNQRHLIDRARDGERADQNQEADPSGDALIARYGLCRSQSSFHVLIMPSVGGTRAEVRLDGPPYLATSFP